MRRHLLYHPELVARARELRKNMTSAEKRLWLYLRQLPCRVLRQRPVGCFIVDFYVPQHRLVIEIDGDTHGEAAQQRYDAERTQRLEEFGLRVLRFTNAEVMGNLEGVWEVLCRVLEE
ncbi:MAG: endonuclease domain-containing protein [Truepera sp.]|nr:endonuclease domain-containing protein [Truepera sp.]